MSINDEEAYQRGLEKLGLETRCRLVTSPLITGECLHGWSSEHGNDLREDPAFAWRVLEALDMIANDRDDVLNALEAFAQKAMAKRHGSTLRDELYTVVCELGRRRG